MAQEQPRRGGPENEPIKYGDVFYVSGEVANQPILPEDAAAMQSAEKIILGLNPLGGPASLMQSAASFNVEAGLVDPGAPKVTDQIRVIESEVDGTRFVTEAVGDEVVGQYVEQKSEESNPTNPPATVLGGEPVTIGEALEAAARCAGDQPIDKADAAAIEAAEKRALGTDVPPSGGLASEAHLAAAWNTRTTKDQFMTTIDDVLKDASEKLGHDDKAVTREDAKEVVKAEVRNDPEMATTIGGVAEMMVAAAKINESQAM